MLSINQIFFLNQFAINQNSFFLIQLIKILHKSSFNLISQIIFIKFIRIKSERHSKITKNNSNSKKPTSLKLILMNQQYNSDRQIVTTNKHIYSFAQKVFCCKCFHCLQDETIFTSNIRKQTLQRMIKNFVINQEDDTLFDPIKLMILIYLCLDQSITKSHIQRCRINPSSQVDTYRTDLEFYIPQLCNYIVFHEDLKHNYLIETIQHATRLDFYFGHLYYFYMHSLEKIVGQHQIRVFKQITQYKERFLNQISRVYEGQMLNSFQYYWGQKIKMYPTDPDTALIIKEYGTKDHQKDKYVKAKVNLKDIYLPNYSSIFNGSEQRKQLHSFKSTLNFFEDLFLVSDDLKNFQDKKCKLKEEIMRINSKLPACVYIPFSKGSLRYYNILNILPNQSRIFSTKQRAPFYICLQVYCPAEILNQENQINFWKKIQRPIALKRNLKSQSIFSAQGYKQRSKMGSFLSRRRRNSIQDPYYQNAQTQIFSQKQSSRYMTNKLLQFTNQQQTLPRLMSKNSQKTRQLKSVHPKDVNIPERMNELFGQSEEQMYDRIKRQSIYGGFQSYSLIHLIVKTSDNLKQEQFALQLIYQFDYIFKLENLPLVLTPYEVLSMGPDSGIIEMVKDSVTFDKLKKFLKTDFSKPYTLKEFFQIYFGDNLSQAKDKFTKSLAAYSLVMYFLQAKDRHNGNILLHKTGKIFHIDFGFFLSNMPGKGMQLEKDCPFKLMSQYIQVLDGPQSFYFKKFRQYLFQGFKAVRRHQNKILMLVKMMYSSGGITMPCFEKGQIGIIEMEKRFNPAEVTNDAQLNLHCQKLIDSSLDNWAAKWYDRWQYWAQGIFY